jgi:hypothetical protein
MELFGYTITKKEQSGKLEAFQIAGDSAVDVASFGSTGVMSYNFDLVTVPQGEVELIKTYRRISLSPDIDLALGEIKNEAFIFDVPGRRAFEPSFTTECELSDQLKEKISEELGNIYNVLDFNNNGVDLFMDFYIDGRIYLHKVIDKSKPKEGIQKIIPIDPIKMKKVRELPPADNKGIYDITKIKEYYIFQDFIDSSTSTVSPTLSGSGLLISPDAIAYADSGLRDKDSNAVIGYLYKAIIPYNNLKLMEDSSIVLRVSRAPDRRVFYVDTGNLPKVKAEQYMKDLMNRFKTKMVYDSKTGSVVDRRSVLSMVEDYWMPRREGGRGTEIQTLDGSDSIGVIADLEYFRGKLYQSLNVPASRFKDEPASFSFGKSTEINRDEYRFKKFLNRVRQRFMYVFEDLLRTQLILKKIISPEDWDGIRRELQWNYTEDNAFVEYKESEIMMNRVETLQAIDPFVGRYYTEDWVLKNIMHYSADEIANLEKYKKTNPKEETSSDF